MNRLAKGQAVLSLQLLLEKWENVFVASEAKYFDVFNFLMLYLDL